MDVVILSFGEQGGMAQYPAQLANALAESVEVTVITPFSEEVEQLYTPDVDVVYFNADTDGVGRFRRLMNRSKTVGEILMEIASADPDLIHIPFFGTRGPLIITPFLKLFGCPIVATVHDPVSHSGLGYRYGGIDLFTFFRVQMTRLVDAIIVHGSGTKQQAIEADYPEDRLTVLPHGLYSHFVQDEAPPETEENTLLFFGNIRQNKGYDRIPEILDIVSEDVDDVQAIVAGQTSSAPQVDDRKLSDIERTLESDSRINFTNEYVPGDQVQTLFERASIVVLPYYDATMSGVAMISYTFETPLVVTDTGDIGPIIRRDATGEVVDPNSTDQIGQAISELLLDDERYEEAKENIASAKEQYSWSSIAADTRRLYASLVNE